MIGVGSRRAADDVIVDGVLGVRGHRRRSEEAFVVRFVVAEEHRRRVTVRPHVGDQFERAEERMVGHYALGAGEAQRGRLGIGVG